MLQVFQASQSLQRVSAQVQGSKDGQVGQTSDLLDLVERQVEFLKPQVVQVFDHFNGVDVQRKHLQGFVVLKTLDLADVVVIQQQVLQVLILACVFNFADAVTRIVNPGEVGWGVEVKTSSDLIVRSIQSDQVF